MSADILKMFYEVWLNPDDRPALIPATTYPGGEHQQYSDDQGKFWSHIVSLPCHASLEATSQGLRGAVPMGSKKQLLRQ